jgi:hypothetical protein
MTRFFAVVLGGAITVFALWLILASLTPPVEAVRVEKIGPSDGPPAAAQPDPLPRMATSAPKPSSPAALPSPIPHAEAAATMPGVSATAISDDTGATSAAEPVAPTPRRGSARCRSYRTYDPARGIYRGYDGRIHACP